MYLRCSGACRLAGASVDVKARALSSPPMLECAMVLVRGPEHTRSQAVPTSVGFRAVRAQLEAARRLGSLGARRC